MAKVKCKVCANLVGKMCSIKKVSIKPNKARRCDAYVYDESKVKARESVEVVRVGYLEQEENRKRMKEELRQIRKALREGQAQGTAKDLGLIRQTPENKIITPGDAEFSMPDPSNKHPLTGDLSRFTTNAKKSEE